MLPGNTFVFLIYHLLFNLALTACTQQGNLEQENQKASLITDSVIEQEVSIPVEGMVCMSCVANVKRTLSSLEGVSAVHVSLEEKRVSISYDTQKVDLKEIRDAINKLGYKAGKAEKENK